MKKLDQQMAQSNNNQEKIAIPISQYFLNCESFKGDQNQSLTLLFTRQKTLDQRTTQSNNQEKITIP